MSQPVTIPEITATELKARIDVGDVPVLVDVREYYEADIADLPEELNPVRIPTAEFADRFGELAKDADLVLYCRSGRRSAWAAQVLLDQGYQKVLNLKGGVLGWRDEVDPTLPRY